jgi:hypothetical protein
MIAAAQRWMLEAGEDVLCLCVCMCVCVCVCVRVVECMGELFHCFAACLLWSTKIVVC